MMPSTMLFDKGIAIAAAFTLSTAPIAANSSSTVASLMVQPYSFPLLSSKLENTIFTEENSVFLVNESVPDLPYGVHNVAFHQDQSNSSLNFTGLDMLKHDFQIDENAEEFLKDYDVLNVLLDAKKHIRQYFPNEVLFLSLAPAVEQDDSCLLLYIKTNLSVEDASIRLDRLDEDWIIDHIEDLRDISIDVMFV